jgi:ABC-type glycerol-3-phosphate transport system substrate-binding protein
MSSVRRIAASGGFIIAMTLALAGCGGDGEPTEPAADTGAAATGAEGTTDTSAFPEGSFKHTATVEEAVENGFTEQESIQAFGADGEYPITFVFEDGSWQHIEVLDDGTTQIGDSGTYTVEGDEVIMVSDAGGAGTYRWSYDGETLGLVLLSDSAGEEDAHDVRLHTEYEFEKAS